MAAITKNYKTMATMALLCKIDPYNGTIMWNLKCDVYVSLIIGGR